MRINTLLFAVAALTGVAYATPITWEVNAALKNGGTVAGSFDYDSATFTFTNISLTTTQDGTFPPQVFSESTCSTANCGFGINIFNSTGYELAFLTPAVIGGASTITGFLSSDSAGLPMDLLSGTVTALPDAPEPATGTMLALGLIAGIMIKRKARVS